MIICTVAAASRACAVYDEVRRSWVQGQNLPLPPGTGVQLAHALADNSIPGLIEALGVDAVESALTTDKDQPIVGRAPVPKADGHASVQFYQVDSIGDDGATLQRYYLTIKEFGPKNKQGNRIAKTLIEQWELTLEEATLFSAFLRKSPSN